jgi:glycosyl transferase family 25
VLIFTDMTPQSNDLAACAHREKAVLQSLFDRIYVINLPHREDRRREIAQELARVGLGWDSPIVRLFDAVRPVDRGDFPSIGARGCFLSHLGVLNEAIEHGYQSVLILEDDMDWAPGAIDDGKGMEGLKTEDWHFLHGGVGDSQSAAVQTFELRKLSPHTGVMLTHFIGLRGPAIRLAADYLAAMLERPQGSPDGGPMHVDGAYSWLRKDHPEIRSFVCHPPLAQQRSSRSDVTEPVGWRSSMLADSARRLRRWFLRLTRKR